ncbi:MAG: lipoyl(octanoyl) transferase LipB [Burkholderiaceae bacterium]
MIAVKWLPRPAPYAPVWDAMREFTATRQAGTPDEIWLVEHTPVYTLGLAGKPEHVLNPGAIPVVRSDRGGQVTYHGPGQVVMYSLLDLRRYGLYVKDYVALLEDIAIQVLDESGLPGACRKSGAPGVYVPQPGAEPAKIAALGVKIRQGCSYHGLALNVAMDLSPFQGINPCGYAGLVTTDLRSCGIHATVDDVGQHLARRLSAALMQRKA